MQSALFYCIYIMEYSYPSIKNQNHSKPIGPFKASRMKVVRLLCEIYAML